MDLAMGDLEVLANRERPGVSKVKQLIKGTDVECPWFL